MSEEKQKKITLRVIGNREQIDKINVNEDKVHVTFRPSGKDFIRIIDRCPRLTLIHLPKSYMRTVSGSFKEVLKLHRIELREGDVWGHRSDISEYVEIDE